MLTLLLCTQVLPGKVARKVAEEIYTQAGIREVLSILQAWLAFCFPLILSCLLGRCHKWLEVLQVIASSP